MKGIESVLLDSSFCIRLLKTDADFHQNTVDYFEYFFRKWNCNVSFYYCC